MTGAESTFKKPFSWRKGYYSIVASGNVSTQLVRMPWASPANRRGLLRKVMITNTAGVAGTLVIWDQDLTNATPPTAGSAGGAIFPLSFAASGSTTTYTADQIPEIPFNAGVAFQGGSYGITVLGEVEYI